MTTMTSCKISFQGASKDFAEKLYGEFVKHGKTCESLDKGHSLINYSNKFCPKKDDRVCVNGSGDNVLSAEEVLEYAFSNYQKYKDMVEGLLGDKLLVDTNGRLRLSKTIIQDLGGQYQRYAPLTTRQYLAVDYVTRGVLSSQKGDLDNSLRDYAKAIAINPQFAEAYINRGVFWTLNNNPKMGIQDMDRAEGFNPNDPLIYSNRGLAWAKLGEHVKAVSDFTKALLLNPEDADTYNNKCAVQVDMGAYKEALESCNHAIQLAPKDSKGHHNHGLVLFKQGNLTGAVESFTKAIQLTSNSPGTFLKRGIVWMDMGDADKAIADFSQVINLGHKFDTVYFNRGLAWARKGDQDKAILDFTEAIKQNPKDSESYSSRGNAYSRKGDLDRALSDYDQAISVSSKNGIAYHNAGHVWFMKGDYDKAIQYFTKSIHFPHKNVAGTYLERALGWLMKGDWQNVVVDIAAILKMPGANEEQVLNELLGFGVLQIRGKFNQKVEQHFSTDTGKDFFAFLAKVFVSYAHWINDAKDKARSKFFDATNMDITFKGKPSKETKEFVEKIVKAMPAEMKKDGEVQDSIRMLRSNF